MPKQKANEDGTPMVDEQGKPVFEEIIEKTYTQKQWDEMSGDMHKYKGNMKELQAALKKRDDDEVDRIRMGREKNEEYKTLYDEQREENENLKNAIAEKNNSFLNSQKISAVKDKLGSLKRPEYNKFIDTSRIIIDNDGNIDQSTVDNEVVRLKQEYPELIKVKVASTLPDGQPESGTVQSKTLHKMSADERNALRRASIEKRSNEQ